MRLYIASGGLQSCESTQGTNILAIHYRGAGILTWSDIVNQLRVDGDINMEDATAPIPPPIPKTARLFSNKTLSWIVAVISVELLPE